MNLLDIIFPKICVGCHREGRYICEDCQKELITPVQICPMCTRPSLDGWTHPRCRTKPGIERLVVGLPYRGMVQDCLKKVKYKSSWDVIAFLFSLCQFPDFQQNFLVTSVPMYAQKERERGFNQADIIAQLLAKRYQLQSLTPLERWLATKPMFGLSKQAREENIRDAFTLRRDLDPIFLRDKTVLLVDDVWTTGATMRECTRVLKQSGVKEVWGVTLAR